LISPTMIAGFLYAYCYESVAEAGCRYRRYGH
jgi:hypothetical protein